MSEPVATDPAPGRAAAPARGVGRLHVLLIVVCGLLVSALALAFSGAAAPIELSEAGPVVRWGIPLVRVVQDISAAVTVGAFLMGGLLVSESRSSSRRTQTGALGAAGALCWGLSGLLGSVLAYADTAGVGLGSSGFFSAWWTSTWQLETLRTPAITAFAALALVVPAWLERGRNAQAWLFAGSVLALLPLALAGHSGGTDSHDAAVNSLAFHLVGACVWVGGLIVLLLLWPSLGKATGRVVQRYSRIAVWCFVAVAASGTLNAAVRLGGLDGLTTRYGILVLGKVALLAVLGVFGYLQRERVVAALVADPVDRPRRALFARLAASETLVMGAAVGLATALSRTAPPVPDITSNPDPVLDRTGYPMPPDFTVARLFTMFRIEWLFTTMGVVAIGVYLVWVLRLRRRGDTWPVERTICWVSGWLLFMYVMDSGIGIYSRVMFSIHMIEHMVISMGVPLLLVLGAPVTLALRAVPRRTDSTLGLREIILAAVHSRVLQVFGNPVVAAVVFFVSLMGFYYSPAFGAALQTHTGHVLMTVHFLLTGYLFVWSLIGIDPGPPKLPAPLRLLVLLVTVAAHAFFGVALMSSTALMAPEFFTALQLPWVPDPLVDQQIAGSVAWGAGELPTLILAILVTRDWLRSDSKEARRQARQAERDGDAELRAYNEELARRARGGRREG